MKRIKKNDTVIVSTGKSKGHIGKVLRVIDNKVIVEGANMVHKAVKPNPQVNEKGGIRTMEAPIDTSNVALYDETTKKAGKVGFRLVEKDGKAIKVRYFKASNQDIDRV